MFVVIVIKETIKKDDWTKIFIRNRVLNIKVGNDQKINYVENDLTVHFKMVEVKI